MNALTEKVIEVAYRFVGQKEAGSNNSGFADPTFQREMQKSGWERGMAWCSLLCETVVRTALLEAGRPAMWNNIEPLFSASALETLHRFQKKGYTVRQVPKPGDLVVWRHGPGPSGHIGLVVAVGANKTFTTIEGNTSGGMNKENIIDRDGDGCLLKSRRYGLPISDKKGSFNLLGFVAPV